jgi:hypothetical protein
MWPVTSSIAFACMVLADGEYDSKCGSLSTCFDLVLALQLH